MGVNVTIDQGNSRAKIAVWHQGQSRPAIVTAVKKLDIAAIDSALSSLDIDHIIYCNVSDSSDIIISHLKARCDNVLEMTHRTPVPLTVDYATPATLGLDRLAAAVGARRVAGFDSVPLLVVDLGTAATYDLVTADGHYRGGNIAPGIAMRLRALNNFTARLPIVDIDGDTPNWGYDTTTALRSGAVDGVVAETEYYRRRLGPEASVILTGGSARLVASRLSFDTIIEPDLVSIGLEAILKYTLGASPTASSQKANHHTK